MNILNTGMNSNLPMELFEFTEGIEVDTHLYKEEIQAQLAWAKGLNQMEILTDQEYTQLQVTLDVAKMLIQTKQFEWKKQDEDIHMNLERFVTESLGEVGKKMHLGRSRNDLIATTLKLFTTNTLNDVSTLLDTFIDGLEQKAQTHYHVIIPGMTHLQNAQPIRLSHFFQGHASAFKRDKQQLDWVAERTMETMPAGSGALAGTGIAINLEVVKECLGFKNLPLSAFDEVGSRDFMLEALESYSHIAIHLSRMAEDLIYWSSSNTGLFKLPSELSTGSSIMPNKRNPDVLELTRARCSHIISSVGNAQLLLKALPTTYNSDLHEMKIIYIRAQKLVKELIIMNTQFIQKLLVDEEKAKSLLENGHLLATELADYITLKGVPFRESYRLVANLVAQANEQNIQVHELAPEVYMKAHVLFEGVSSWMNFEHACNRRSNAGGTSYLKLAH